MLTMISFEKSHTYSKLKEFSLLNPLFSCLIPSGSDVFVTLVGTANVSREGGQWNYREGDVWEIWSAWSSIPTNWKTGLWPRREGAMQHQISVVCDY